VLFEVRCGFAAVPLEAHPTILTHTPGSVRLMAAGAPSVAPGHRDVTYHTRTPAALRADGTAALAGRTMGRRG
jgi:hypothetical protein